MNIGGKQAMDKRQLDDHHSTSVQRIKETFARFGTPELLHSVYWNSGRAVAEIASHLQIPFVHTVISNGWRRIEAGYRDQPPQRLEIERHVFCAATQVFCICSQERDDLVTFYGVAPERISIVGRPVASPFLMPCRNGYGVPRILPLTASQEAINEL
jgi:D-inositol-3-phosphate glycosyltransferase